MSMAGIPVKRRRLFHLLENSVTPLNCCSSTESTHSSDLAKEIPRNLDLVDGTSTSGTDCGYIVLSSRGEKTTESGVMESAMRASPVEKSASAEKMPSEAELEEFFAAAEKQIYEKFAEKYNFDVTKEQPVEGRYEWVKIRP